MTPVPPARHLLRARDLIAGRRPRPHPDVRAPRLCASGVRRVPGGRPHSGGPRVGLRRMWPPEALQFLRDLEANNDRDWFRANRARYDAHLVEPARDLAT